MKALFAMLNEEWIVRYFALEPKETELLADPQGLFLDRGGKNLPRDARRSTGWVLRSAVHGAGRI